MARQKKSTKARQLNKINNKKKNMLFRYQENQQYLNDPDKIIENGISYLQAHAIDINSRKV